MKKVVSTKPKAVALIRVSTRKQAIKGDQDVQLNKCQAYAEKEGWDLTVFKITETSTVDEREEFNKIIDYCTNSKNSVKYFLIYNISRFTRQGSDVYFELRSRLENAGVKLKDVDGKIQETRNTFEDLNLEYNFSKESPSEKQETAEANEAKSESKKALQTMMRYETEYVRMGFWTRKSLYGFQNVKIDTDKGERTIMIEMPSEANIMRTIFNMLAQGIDENTIVQKANSMGFKSRITKLRDKANMKKVVGYRGGKPLTVKRMREMIWNTAYAGVIAEKWTLHKPVKAKFKGLVDIEIYNLALKGKKVIQEGTNGLEILLNQKPKARMSHNPLYPFKSLKCHVCGNSLLGSAPKSKSGKHIPRYHCSRNHKYWSENKKNFEKTIYKFISEVNFSKKYFLLFKEIVRDVWLKKQQDAVQESLTYGQKVIQLRAEKQSLLDKIKSTSNNYLINELALEMEKIDNEIIQAELHRDDKEEKEHDIESLLNYTEYFMEHLEELLIDRDNPIKQIALFDLLFEEMPTYRNIYNGTPK